MFYQSHEYLVTGHKHFDQISWIFMWSDWIPPMARVCSDGLLLFESILVWVYSCLSLLLFESTLVWVYSCLSLFMFESTLVCEENRYQVQSTHVWAYSGLSLLAFESTQVWDYLILSLLMSEPTHVWVYSCLSLLSTLVLVYSFWVYSCLSLLSTLVLVYSFWVYSCLSLFLWLSNDCSDVLSCFQIPMIYSSNANSRFAIPAVPTGVPAMSAVPATMATFTGNPR